MATRIVLLFMSLAICALSFAQGVKISPQPGNPAPSAILEIQDTTRGVLMPRVNLQSLTDAVTIANPATSLMVFNTGTTLAPSGLYIENLATPVNPADAVTKDYVDNQIINLSGSGGGSCACPTMLSNESASTVNLATAARNCGNLVEGGFSDWYLPTLDDVLLILSTNPSSISNNTSPNPIWTRTKAQAGNDGRFYNYIHLSDGNTNWSTSTGGGIYYRCAR